MANSSTGLDENIAAALSYLLGWVTGIIFFLLEPDRPFIRFHAAQSIVTFSSISIAMFILSWVPFIGYFISALLGLLAFILWLILIIKAYQGERYKLPIAGDLAEKLAAK